MPIRKEWRKYYRGPEWQAARANVLKRAGGKFDGKGKYLGGARCEQCGKPDRERVETFTDSLFGPLMFWREVGGGWRDWLGRPRKWADVDMSFPSVRIIRVVITTAHLDHNPANSFEYNLRGLCQWCHLHYDAPHHKATRSERKDAARPLLAAATKRGEKFEGLERKT